MLLVEREIRLYQFRALTSCSGGDEKGEGMDI